MKKWKKRLGYAVAILLLLSAFLAWDGRVMAMIRFVGNAHQPGLDDNFEILEELLPGPGAEMAELYRGLPHPFGEREEFVRDLWTESNRSIHGYRFYKQAETPLPQARSALVDLLSKPETFGPYRGPKMCGGYHADFAVRLESSGESAWFLICLGCGEVLIYSKGKELICEFERESEEKLREAWNDQRGVPFEWVGTRLPIADSVLAEMGLIGRRPSTSGRMDWGGFKRVQTLLIDPARRASGEEWREFKVKEESLPSADEALKRAESVLRPVARNHMRGKPRSWEEGFMFGDKIYRVSGLMEHQEELAAILDRLRSYCEASELSEVRAYD